jgi:hypothetical protein
VHHLQRRRDGVEVEVLGIVGVVTTVRRDRVEQADEVDLELLEKIDGENRTRDEIRAGAKLADVYARYGVL